MQFWNGEGVIEDAIAVMLCRCMICVCTLENSVLVGRHLVQKAVGTDVPASVT